MLDLLIRRFVPNHQETARPEVRTAYSVLAGALGIALNLMLFAVKLPIGLITGSIAITSDAFNNLSDMGSSLIGVIGARLAGRKPDREHPFGHGRLEYVAALIVSFLILLVGFELLKESALKLLHPQPVAFNPLLLGILALSMLVKVYMYAYNKKLGALIGSQVMKATASDSLNDALTTGVVVISQVLNRFVSWPIDALAGLALSVLILRSGYGVAKDTIDLLLGGRPDPKLARRIAHMVREGEGVTGVHDLIIHDYGPGRVMASVHAEVSADSDIMKVHEAIDRVERRVYEELGVPLVIHMDPLSYSDEHLEKVRADLEEALRRSGEGLSFHDLRVGMEGERVSVRFDLLVPEDMQSERAEEIVRAVKRHMAEADARYACVIQVDQDYAGIS